MGTRSITLIKEDDTELCRIYRQHDGYPETHGSSLAALCNVDIVNGLCGGRKDVANGMGCLAARVIAGLKDGPGGVYLYPPNSGVPDEDQEFVYTVTGKVGEKPRIKCEDDTGFVVFDGFANEILEVW